MDERINETYRRRHTSKTTGRIRKEKNYRTLLCLFYFLLIRLPVQIVEHQDQCHQMERQQGNFITRQRSKVKRGDPYSKGEGQAEHQTKQDGWITEDLENMISHTVSHVERKKQERHTFKRRQQHQR